MSARLDPDRWRRVAEVLDAALACELKDRTTVLDEACVGAPELRREVEDLLARVEDARGFLESPPAAVAAAVIAEVRDAQDSIENEAGRLIGRYRLAREIGRGGMSRVFLAHRADGHFEQQVALKLMRAGLDAEIDHARFRAERQILASLNHPNIARLLDGGLTDGGQPYLALEFVEGQPIDVYCDAHALSVRQRLELFLMAVEATQYAHRNLVVHLDIKPSNILVSVDGLVKLLDFGLAKLTEPSALALGALPTLPGAHWLTPQYAAPEQIRREPVTTLTDVYQLGAVLYRLLSGRLPFAARGGDLRELEAAVLQGDPTPPSIVAAESDPHRAKLLRGDLDAIVLKAMSKEPGDRYESVERFADDLRRHLSRHPVLARRSTSFYRARRFVRRHRVETFAAAVISVSVVTAAGVSVRMAQRASAERAIAAVASRESQAVTSFLMGLFETSDLAEARGDTLTANELVRRAAARAERLGGQPLAQARMLEVTGQLYQNLGQYGEAYAMLQRAVAVRQNASAGDSLELAGTLDKLAAVLVSIGRYAAADSVARQALGIQEGILGPRHQDVAVTLHHIASIAVFRGDLSAAEAYHRRALVVREEALGPGDSLTALSHLALGATIRREGRIADAEREFRRGLAILERSVGPDDPRLADAIIQIAYLADEDRARYDDAGPLYLRALEIRRHAFGDGHPMFAATLLDFAAFLSRRGDRAGAVAPARRAVEIVHRAYGREHPTVADFSANLAAILYRAGNLDEAETLFRQSIATDRRVRGQNHETIAGLEMGLARILIDRRDYSRADSLLHDAVRIREHANGPEHPATAAAEGLLGMLLTREGRYVAADSVLRHSLATMERQVGREHQDVRELYGWLADLDDARGRRADAGRDRAIANAR